MTAHRSRRLRRPNAACVHTPRLPKADPVLAQHFYALFGASLLVETVIRSAEEVMQSMQLALLAHRTGLAPRVLMSRHTHLCGPHAHSK